jgi:predicted component of type VI protein secretion system
MPPAAAVRQPTIYVPSGQRSSHGRAGVTVVSGPCTGLVVALSAGDFWIGSSGNNNLCLSGDPAVSGNHAAIRNENGVYRLYDNGSLNNTFVNGRPVGGDVVLLRAGDSIRTGQSEMTIEF